ncbi:cytochrome P450 monooxygenase [Cucurbitaria berberidis CBS 394.84]|uniref:Cytochrome P450 monooxygenase n=1 Tax=Cucurbitaria berberidis CBS 394.84 TaxID=1168544 RepID=A0A9P4L9M2_9PLEO|nr:cytochrome P450 monooxygenase [Cucurbitaria berberidis CBS 394.84]KAF1847371.1 cytochrome P450 monooxygenase [Cucurbitaria berberidis CBS 394.84]
MALQRGFGALGISMIVAGDMIYKINLKDDDSILELVFWSRLSLFVAFCLELGSRERVNVLEYLSSNKTSLILSVHESAREFTFGIAAILIPLLWTLWVKWSKSQRLAPGILIVGGKSQRIKNRKAFIHGSRDILMEGYGQSGGDFYYVPSTLGERLMVPFWVLDELKTSPVDKVDFVGTFIEMFEGKYTTMGSRSTLHPRVVKAQLNQHLPEVMPGVQDEIRNAFQDSFPKCNDWTEVPVVDRITQIVARVSSRMFGGTTLSENAEWVQASIDFALDGFVGAQKLKKIPKIFRPVASRFIPEITKIAGHYRAAEKASMDMIEQRRRTGERASDLLFWMDQQAVGPEKDPKFLASILLKVSFAAIHTSAAAPSQLIFDLCQYPEYVEPLRQEYRNVLDREGRISKQGYLRMPKLDSIMKESQRFNPLLLVTFERIITEKLTLLKKLTLSNGFVIPANTMIGIPTHAITMDPGLYPKPEKFDGFCFAKLRQEDPSMEGKGQYVASNPNSMAFGFGRYACPGCFFAAQEIKAIMVFLLENYDMKFKEGQTRPLSLVFETQYLPDHSTLVLFKRR